MTIEEVKNLIESTFEEKVWANVLANGNFFDEETFEINEDLKEKADSIGLEIVECHQGGGKEDEGHECWICVFKIYDQFYKAFGWYSSYDGVEFDMPYTFIEVKPVQKMVTFYEKI